MNLVVDNYSVLEIEYVFFSNLPEDVLVCILYHFGGYINT